MRPYEIQNAILNAFQEQRLGYLPRSGVLMAELCKQRGYNAELVRGTQVWDEDSAFLAHWVEVDGVQYDLVNEYGRRTHQLFRDSEFELRRDDDSFWSSPIVTKMTRDQLTLIYDTLDMFDVYFHNGIEEWLYQNHHSMTEIYNRLCPIKIEIA